MKEKRRFAILFFVIPVLLIFSISSPASAWEWPKDLTALTTGLGTGTYVQTVGWGSIIEQKTGVKFRAMPSNNYSERAMAHKQGRAVLNVDTITTINAAVEARTSHATRDGGTYATNLVWVSMFVPFGFAVLKDSSIQSVYDLKKIKNLKVALFRTSDSSVRHVKGILAWAGVDEKDVIFVPTTSWSGNTKAIVEGKADITFTSPISKVTYEVEAHPKGIRWIDFPQDDKEGEKRYLKKMPGIAFVVNQKGVKSAHGKNMMINISYYHAKASTDSDLIYNLAKWLGENYESYKNTAKGCAEMNIENMRKALDLARRQNYLPVHPGSIRYLKEKGMWSSDDDVWNEKCKALVKRWVETYDDAIADADKKKISIKPSNETWMNLWKSHKKDLPSFGTGLM